MRIVILLVLSFFSSLNVLEAQWLSHRYEGHRYENKNEDRNRYEDRKENKLKPVPAGDAVRGFLNDFCAEHPQINNSVVIDNDSVWINSAIAELKYLSTDRGYTKVRKAVYNATTKKNKYIDSITLGKKELKLIVQKLTESKTYYWPGDYYPKDRLITSDDLRALYTRDPQARKKTAVWYFSLPLFMNEGERLVCYHMYSCGNDCGQDELAIYENIGGHWQKFGSVFSRKF